MKLRSILLLTALTLLPATAHAQSKKELAAQDRALSERITRLESRMLSGDPAVEQLVQRIDALESQSRTLTGEVETLRHEKSLLAKDVSALALEIAALQELASRTRIHLQAVDAVAARSQSVLSPQPPDTWPQGETMPSSEAQIATPTPAAANIPKSIAPFERAGRGKDRMLAGDYTGARADFTAYLEAAPDAADSGDVQFWLGETYFIESKYSEAASAYIGSMRSAPNGLYAPEAMVRLASTARSLGKQEAACQTLASFPAEYPAARDHVKALANTERSLNNCP